MSDCYQLIVGLRAIRDFGSQPLRREHLDMILEAARWTGSSKNRQDWSFVVVTGDRLEELARHGDFTTPVRRSAATIVLVQEPGGNLFDIGRAGQNIMMAAASIGVASCPITLHRADDARQFTGAPRDRLVRYAVALGYPAETAVAARMGGRKGREQVIHRESYGSR